MERIGRLEHKDYQIGVVCALAIEKAAVRATLDEEHPSLERLDGDDNQYTLGRIQAHNVVIACLPAGDTGTANACNVATHMQRTFPIKYGLMVGIAGGVWSKKHDVHLGDVVVSQPGGRYGSVVQYDFGKTAHNGRFERTTTLSEPPRELLQSLQTLKENHAMKGSNLPDIVTSILDKLGSRAANFKSPGTEQDQLFAASYHHVSGDADCDSCDFGMVPDGWRRRETPDPQIYYGTIASANQVMRHGPTRDIVAKDLGAICFEMEAAGLMNTFPCLVIRGICDYADTHKNKSWQGYAAVTAAAFAKDLLGVIPKQGLPITLSALDGNEYWMVPRGSSPLFTGRASIIEKLEQQLCSSTTQSENKQRRCVIVGMGGMGKSEICLKVAENLRERFSGVFWVDASSRATAERGFVDIGRICNLSEPNFKSVKQWLAATNHKWLLIIDNADDPSTDYADYFPSGNRGQIILTTRIPECRRHSNVGFHTLENLEHSEAIELLLRAACIDQEIWESSRAAAEKVVNILGSHALAIVHAGAFVERGLCALSDYPTHFKEQRQRLLQFRPTQAQSIYKDVYATFEVSAKCLEDSPEKSAKNALELLRFLAFVHFDNVPMSILERAWDNGKLVSVIKPLPLDRGLRRLNAWHASQLPSFMRPMPVASQKRNSRLAVFSALSSKMKGKRRQKTQSSDCVVLFDEPDKDSLHEAGALLASFSIISVNPKSGNMTMHPLAHAWAKDRLKPSAIEEAAVSAGCILALSLSMDGNYDASRAHVVPHFESWWASASFKPSMVPSGMISCLYLLGKFLYFKGGRSIVNRIFNLLVSCDNFKGTATSRHRDMCYLDVGTCYILAKNPRKAIEILEKCLQKSRRIMYGREDADIQEISSKLAYTYLAVGESHKALQLSQEMLHSYKQAHPNSSGVIYFQRCLAKCYLNADVSEPGRAVSLLEEIVGVAETETRVSNTDRRQWKIDLARAYLQIKEPQKAIRIMEELVKTEKTKRETYDPVLLRLQRVLAEAYLSAQGINQARELLEHLVSTQAMRLDAEDFDRIYALYLSCEACVRSGLTGKAIETQREADRILKSIREPEDLTRLGSKRFLAKLLIRGGEYDEAIEILEECIRIQRTTLPPMPKRCLESESRLGEAYLRKGETDKAVELLEKVVQMSMNELPPEHQTHLRSEYWLAKAYFQKGDFDKKVELLEKMAQIRMDALPPGHWARLNSENWLARAYLAKGETDKAVELLEKVVQMSVNELPPEHRTRLRSEYWLAKAYFQKGDFDKKVELLEKVAQIRMDALPPGHWARLNSENWLARAYLAKGETDKAVEFLKRIDQVRVTTLEPNHEGRQKSQVLLARALQQTEDDQPGTPRPPRRASSAGAGTGRQCCGGERGWVMGDVVKTRYFSNQKARKMMDPNVFSSLPPSTAELQQRRFSNVVGSTLRRSSA